MAWPRRTNVKSLYSWKPLCARPVDRPRTRWEDNIKADIKKMKVPEWKIPVQDRTKWKGVVQKTKTLCELFNPFVMDVHALSTLRKLL
jgi:hypothetical protein